MRAIPNLPWTALPPTVGVSGKPGQLQGPACQLSWRRLGRSCDEIASADPCVGAGRMMRPGYLAPTGPRLYPSIRREAPWHANEAVEDAGHGHAVVSPCTLATGATCCSAVSLPDTGAWDLPVMPPVAPMLASCTVVAVASRSRAACQDAAPSMCRR